MVRTRPGISVPVGCARVGAWSLRKVLHYMLEINDYFLQIKNFEDLEVLLVQRELINSSQHRILLKGVMES